MEKNGPDIKAIVEKIGLDNLIALFPHLAACAATYLEAQPKKS